MRYSVTLFVLILFLMFSFENVIGQEKRFVAIIDTNGIQRIEVLAGEYFIDPNHIIVKANVPVEIKIKKEPSLIPHDFVLKAPEAGIDILEKLSIEAKLIRFTPLKPGKYTFYCDKRFLFFTPHREKGMEGILEVIE